MDFPIPVSPKNRVLNPLNVVASNKYVYLVVSSVGTTKSKYGRDCVLWQRKDQIKQRENT